MIKKIGLLLVLNIISVTFVHASNKIVSEQISDLIEQAKTKNLASHPYWLKLLRFKQHQNGQGTGISEINSPEFFSSEVGRFNPEAELIAVLHALFEQPAEDHNSHAQCRFVARYNWLRKMLDWSGAKPPNVDCPEFRFFSKNNKIDSISMVYASGYLSNPASFYGHPFIKFNSSSLTNESELLDTVVSYGAIIPENENGIKYIFNGLFGGYTGRYTNQQFYSFNHVYGENDLRDLWSYKLNLSQEEIDQIVAHAWEVLDKDYDYYFLKENCALRMADLLNLVVDDSLLPDNLPWAMPSTMFDYLVRTNHGGRPIVAEVRRIPSRQNRFYLKYDGLTQEQKMFVARYIEKNTSFQDETFQVMSDHEKTEILDTLIDYYEFLLIQNKREKSLAASKKDVLIERAKFAAQEIDKEPANAENIGVSKPPHTGPLPLLFQSGVFHNKVLGNGVKFRVRPAFFDHMSIDSGRIPNSILSMMDIELMGLEDELLIRKIDFVYVESLNISKTQLPGDGGVAWDLRVSYQTRDYSCNDCHVFNLSGGFGKAFSLSRQTTLFGMLDFFAETEYAQSENIGYFPRIGFITNPVPAWKSYISIGEKRYVDGAESSDNVLNWENRFGNSRDWDIRLNYHKHRAEEYTLAVSLYW